MSFAEIYNEFIYDLLAEAPARGRHRPSLKISQDKHQNYYIRGTYILEGGGERERIGGKGKRNGRREEKRGSGKRSGGREVGKKEVSGKRRGFEGEKGREKRKRVKRKEVEKREEKGESDIHNQVVEALKIGCDWTWVARFTCTSHTAGWDMMSLPPFCFVTSLCPTMQ